MRCVAGSRAKNEIHAVLQRRLRGKPPCSDLFGVKARRWLVTLEFPGEERESVDAGVRHVECGRSPNRRSSAPDPPADDGPRA
jgi:hypothetical protein